eukprot:GHVO01020792.1.p1 GENE.GHVO01020792.1~~GHVO01020792.1.p1  ORF type:complete len:195 (-),score=12.47 GHVO01020792.1:187-771(-)
MIRKSSGSQACKFHQVAKPKCSKSNKCDFECEKGFSKITQSGNPTCACPANKAICNDGTCQNSCPSAVPGHKRDHLHWGKHKQQSCKPGWTACGISGGRKNDWECVNTHDDLESCGGCPFDTTSLTSDVIGVDCTTLPGVADVSCVSGICDVTKCMEGFEISRSGQHCEIDERKARGGFGSTLQIMENVLLSKY